MQSTIENDIIEKEEKQLLQDNIEILTFTCKEKKQNISEKYPFTVRFFIENCSTLYSLSELSSEATEWDDVMAISKSEITYLVRFLKMEWTSPPVFCSQVCKKYGVSDKLLLLRRRFSFAFMEENEIEEWIDFLDKDVHSPFLLLRPFAVEMLAAKQRDCIEVHKMFSLFWEQPLFSLGTHTLLKDFLDKDTKIVFLWEKQRNKRWIKVTNGAKQSLLVIVSRLYSTKKYFEDETLMALSLTRSFDWIIEECWPYPGPQATIKEMEKYVTAFPCKSEFPFPLLSIPTCNGNAFFPTLRKLACRTTLCHIVWEGKSESWIFKEVKETGWPQRPYLHSIVDAFVTLALSVPLPLPDPLPLDEKKETSSCIISYMGKEMKVSLAILNQLKWFKEGIVKTLDQDKKKDKETKKKKRKKLSKNPVLVLEPIQRVSYEEINEFFTTLQVKKSESWIRCILYFDPPSVVIDRLKKHLTEVSSLDRLWDNVPCDGHRFIEPAWISQWMDEIPLGQSIPLILWEKMVELQREWCYSATEFLLTEYQGSIGHNIKKVIQPIPDSDHLYLLDLDNQVHVIAVDRKKKTWKVTKKVAFLNADALEQQVRGYLELLCDRIQGIQWYSLCKNEWALVYNGKMARVEFHSENGWRVDPF